MKLSKKKAFTLVELLVVVLVLGVLASVGVPKFKRMLETRKTGEAEAMLAAVRMEQEKRCIAGKKYWTDLNKLDVMANASGSKNYTYKLTSTGIVAEAKGKSKEADKYNLQLTSYKEGNICCAGAGCKKLNKNYPECKALVRDECSANVECTGEEPAHDKTETVGRCKLDYTQNVECDKDYGAWNTSGFVLANKYCDCEGDENGSKIEGRCTIDFTQECDRSTGEMINYQETGKTCTCEGQSGNSTTKTEWKTIGHGECLQSSECNTGTGEWGNWVVDYGNCRCDEGYTYNSSTKTCDKEEPEEPGGPEEPEVSTCTLTAARCKEIHNGLGMWSVGSTDGRECRCRCTSCPTPVPNDRCYGAYVYREGNVSNTVYRYGTFTYGNCNISTCEWDTYKCDIKKKVWKKIHFPIQTFESNLTAVRIIDGITECDTLNEVIMTYANGIAGYGCNEYNCTGLGSGRCCGGATSYKCQEITETRNRGSFSLGTAPS